MDQSETSNQALATKKKLNHHLVFSLSSLIIVIAVAIGVYTWQHSKVKTLDQKIKHLDSQVASLNSRLDNLAGAPSAKTLTDNSVMNLLGAFYKDYFNAEGAASVSTQSGEETEVGQQFGTSNLINYLNPSVGTYNKNPITCSLDLPYLDSVNVTDIHIGGSSATALVTEYLSGDQVNINTKVVETSGTLKLDQINCNPPLKASIETGP
jgi:hypothetical protein